MPRRDKDTGRPYQSGTTRVIRETVPDHPLDRRTWSEEQRWDGMKPAEFERTFRNAGVTKRRRMKTYMRRIGDGKKLRIIRQIEGSSE